MSLRFCDSFDHYVTADLIEKWSSSTNSPAISSGNGRRSTSSARLPYNSATTATLTKTLDAQATWIVGFAFKVDLLPTVNAQQLVALLDAGTLQTDVRLNLDGTLSVTRNATVLGTSSYALSIGVVYYIEFKCLISDASGTYEVRVDGSNKVSGSSADTKNTANATANQIRIGSTVNSNPTKNVDFDDLYICDGAGSTNNNFLGDCRVDAYLPSGNGNSSVLVGSDGNSTDNYLLVDETAPNADTDYVQSSTSGDLDDYAFADMTHTPTSIFGIQVLVNAKKDDAGSRSVATLTRSGSTNYAGATQALGTSYTYYSDIRETDPDTAVAWTKAGFNAASHGVKVAA
jgi:hypothetical protein